MKQTAFILLFVACAHKPPLPPVVPPSMVPRAAVDAMCSRMHAEGISTELRALKISQPLITSAAVEALSSAMSYNGRKQPQITAAGAVPVETTGSCVAHPIDAIGGRDYDVMVVSFSAPFENPFVPRQLGVFARLSLGSEAATWYWVPIAERNGAWAAAAPVMLAVRD